MKLKAKYTFKIPATSNCEVSFTKDKEYEFTQMSSGSYFIMDDSGLGMILGNDRLFINFSMN